MRIRPTKAAGTLVLAALLSCPAASPARAQATHDPRPLDQTPPYHMPSGGPAAAHAHPPAHALPPGKQPPLVVPAAPPPPPVLPPPIPVPTRPPPPVTPAPVVPDAPGEASKAPAGLRITFGPDRADLNPESDAAITALAHAAPGPDASFTITAYATGGDDPSTPRRMSLSRALAVRSALMQAGIPSVKIYVKALGATAPTMAEGPPDRADIVVTAGPAPGPSAPAQPPPPAPPTPPGAPAATTPPAQAPGAPGATEKAAP